MSNLAILGGEPVISKPYEVYRSVGKAEKEALSDVIDRNCLSGFFASWEHGFSGGYYVNKFEEEWKKLFSVDHCVAVNSATSGLYAAMGAIGISPGDEVIVPPFSMSATVVAPLIYGGIPVFSRIEEETFGLDPKYVIENITDKTKAILVVNLFGHSAKLLELKEICKKYNLYLIEDNSQSPLAKTDDGKFCGTVGDIGIFSLNYHKHIHTGEGGMCVTNNNELSLRLKLIRNHAENVVNDAHVQDLTNMVGFNYRMTELSAAVGIAQIRDIHHHLKRRIDLAEFLTNLCKPLEGLSTPVVRPNCTHVYYVWALKCDEATLGVSRDLFSKALELEGFPNFQGYVRPLYKLPLFQKRIAFGRNGYPFTLTKRSYQDVHCPISSSLQEKTLLGFEPCRWEILENDYELLEKAFMKVYKNRHKLKDIKLS